jgi:hypothetical protein
VWRLRVFAGRDASHRPIQRRRTLDSRTGKVNAGVREARAALTQMRAEVQEAVGTGRTAVETGWTVARFMDRCIAHCETQDRSPTTLDK